MATVQYTCIEPFLYHFLSYSMSLCLIYMMVFTPLVSRDCVLHVCILTILSGMEQDT